MAMAYDVPEENIPMWGKISLPEYLDYHHSGDGWTKDVVAWHVTTKENLELILKNGLRTSSCSNWTSDSAERPEAVYLFCAKSVVVKNIRALLDKPEDAVVLKVIIPKDNVKKLHIDNLYNVSVEVAYMSAIQYRDSIPAEWIVCEQ